MSPVVPPQSRAGSAGLGAGADTVSGGPSAALAAGAVLRELVLDSVDVPQWVWGPTGLVRVSPSAAGLLGLRDADPTALQACVTDVLGPILTARAAGASWDSYDLETDVPADDGVLRRIRVTARSVPGHDGWVVGVLAPVGTGIADVEDRYQLLLELSPDALIVHEMGKIVYANPAAVAFARAGSLNDLLGASILSFVAPESQPELLQRLAALTGPGSVSEPSEAILLRLDGTSLVMEAVSVRTSWNGRPAFQVIMRDLSERRAAEAAIRQQASLVEHVSDAIVAVDLDGVVTNWNPAARAIFGWPAAEAVGQRLETVLGADCASELAAAVGNARFEVQLTRRTGEQIDVEVAVDDVLDSFGAVSGRVMIASDITERRHRETEKEVAAARLRHQSRHDALTGLANRAMVVEHLAEMLERATGRGLPSSARSRRRPLRWPCCSSTSTGSSWSTTPSGTRPATRCSASSAAGCSPRCGPTTWSGGSPATSSSCSSTSWPIPASLDRLVDRLFGALAEPLRGQRAAAHRDREHRHRDARAGRARSTPRTCSATPTWPCTPRSRAAARARCGSTRSCGRRRWHSLELEEDLRRAVSSNDIRVAYQPLVDLAERPGRRRPRRWPAGPTRCAGRCRRRCSSRSPRRPG